MKSNTIDLSPRQFFGNDEIEPWFNFESLDKRSPDALLAFGDQVYWSFSYSSLDFNDDIYKRRNGGLFEWNKLKEIQNYTTKADIMTSPDALTKDEHLIIKEPLIQNQVTKFEPLEQENGFSQISDNDSICDNKSHEDSNYDPEDDSGVSLDWEINIEEDKELHQSSKNMTKNTGKFGTLNKIREICPKRKKEQGVKQIRWNRKIDREVFLYLRDELNLHGMNLQQFLFDNKDKVVDDARHTIKCNARFNILDQIWIKFKWLNTHYHLYKRLRKLATNQSFSFREKKLLKDVLASQKQSKSFSMKSLTYLFPGKFEETIRKISKRILNLKVWPF